MRLFADNGFYEIMYDNRRYEFLQFIRIDNICEISYVTLKNVITGEMFTFDQERIHKISKKMFRLPSKFEKSHIDVAEKRAHSLY